MKSYLLTIVFILAGFVLAAQVELGKDPAAKKILDAVSKKVSESKGIRIKFSYKVENKQNGYEETQNGYVFLNKDKFKAIIHKTEILSDGVSVWTYNKEDEEVTISNTDTSEVSIFNPVKLFTAYRTGFKYLLIGEEKIKGASYYVIDLYPDSKEHSPYSIIRIKINKASKDIYFLKTSGKSGIDYIFEIHEYKSGVSFPKQLFVFDKAKYPADIEIIDLR